MSSTFEGREMIALYFLLIVAADFIAANWMVPILPGIMAPAGSLLVGPILTVRDQIHDRHGVKGVIPVILAASAISWLVGGWINQGLLQSISIASAIAFIGSELIADTGVYAGLHKSKWFVRVSLSNLASAPIDSILFIGLAFGVFVGASFWSGRQFMIGQTIAKLVSGLVWTVMIMGVRSWTQRYSFT